MSVLNILTSLGILKIIKGKSRYLLEKPWLKWVTTSHVLTK